MDRKQAFATMQQASQALTRAIRHDDYNTDRQAYDRRVEAASNAHLEASRAYGRALAAENVNAAVDHAFLTNRLETGPFMTSDAATTRIGHKNVGGLWLSDHAYVYVSDHRTGRGQVVPMREANGEALDVRVTTRRARAERENVDAGDLAQVIGDMLSEVAW